MKPKSSIPTLTAAAFLVFAPQIFAQQTGVSRPQALDDDITVPPPAASQHYVKPSPAVPADSVSSTIVVTPATPAVSTSTPTLQTRPVEPMAPVQTAALRNDPTMNVTDDPTSGVVMEVPSGPDELPIGTLLKANLTTQLSTKATQVESHFNATLSVDVVKHGRVLLPAGTVISGRVTQVHGGSRFSGPAAIRLQPDIIKLPGGMAYELEADVIDLDRFKSAHVNNEGIIVGNDDTKQTATTFAATAGGGAAFGAMVGGGVGAVVGAGIGAGVGTVVWLRRDRQESLPQGTSIVFSLDRALDLSTAGR